MARAAEARWGGTAQVLLDPVTLPCCGNSFDKACLDKHVEANPNGAAACPICRTALPATLPAVGVGRSLGFEGWWVRVVDSEH